MSPVDLSTPWLELGRLVLLESGVLFLLALGAGVLFPSPAWRRTAWQAALAGIALVTLAEAFGLGGALRSWTTGSAATGSTGQVSPALSAGTESPVRTGLSPLSAPGPAPLSSLRLAAAPVHAPPPPANGILSAAPDAASAWPLWIWAAGSTLLLGRLVGSRLAFRFLKPRHPVTDPGARAAVAQLAARLGLRRKVQLAELEGLWGPVAHGLLRPGIILPAGFTSRFNETQQRSMLAHELAHLAAGDPFWNEAAHLIVSLLWWHPLAWLARRQLRAVTETAADEASLLVENGPDALAECLVALGSRMTARQSPGWLGIENPAFRSRLGQRVHRLLHLDGRSWRPPSGRRTSLCLSLCLPAGAGALLLAGPAVTRAGLGHEAAFAEQFHHSALGLALAGRAPSSADPSGLPLALPAELRTATKPASPAGVSGDPHPTLAQAEAPDPVPVPRPNPATPAPTPAPTPTAQPAPAPTGAVAAGTNRVPGLAELPIVGKPLTKESKISAPNSPGLEANTGLDKGQDLHTRWFKVDPINVAAALRGISAGTNATPAPSHATTTFTPALLEQIRTILRAGGVDFSIGGRQLVATEQGMLLARATPAEMTVVEQSLAVLNASPPQVDLEVKLCELTGEATRALARQQPAGSALAALRAWTDPRSGAAQAAGETHTSILNRGERDQLIELLLRQPGANLLSAPRVTTLSGRQAQVKTVQVRYVVTDLDFTTNNPSPASAPSIAIQPLAEPFELGPIVDLIPHVSADGHTISLTVIAQIKEFQGYDNEKGMRAAFRRGGEQVAEQRTPLPRFVLRQIMASAAVRDGHTLLLVGGTDALEPLVKESKGQAASPKGAAAARRQQPAPEPRTLLVLVTPRIIDSAGQHLELSPR